MQERSEEMWQPGLGSAGSKVWRGLDRAVGKWVTAKGLLRLLVGVPFLESTGPTPQAPGAGALGAPRL